MKPQPRRILGWILLSALFVPSMAWAIIRSTPVACGGSRASNSLYEIHSTGEIARVTLRGSTFAEVLTVSPTQKAAVWVSGRMFGEIPGIGRVVARVAGQPQSYATVDSYDPQGASFYPAFASQTLYWAFDVIDANGAVTRTLINPQPMLIEADIVDIPPFGTPFPIDSNVVFYDEVDLSTPVLTILGGQSQGILEEVEGLDVRLAALQTNTATSTFQTVWEVENVTGVPLDIHWFATGIHGAQVNGPADAFDVSLGAGNTLSVAINGFFDPGNLDAGVVFHATSVPNANVAAEGHLHVQLQQE